MQCGTEAEIKERHRQTERWVGGGRVHWVGGGGHGDTEKRRDGEVRKGGSESSHFSSSEHPFPHIIISVLLSCVTALTLRKIDSLITTACKSACLPVNRCLSV